MRNENFADSYETWNSEKQVRKYRVKEINSERNEETKIRLNIAIPKPETGIILLRLRVLKFKEKFEKSNRTIQEEITDDHVI